MSDLHTNQIYTQNISVTGSILVSGSIGVTHGIGMENYRATSRWALPQCIGAPALSATALTSGSGGAITTIIVPFVITRPTLISSLSFEVTATNTTTASVGVYNADQRTCRPTTLFASMSNIIIAGNRAYSGSLTNGPVLFNPGLYFTAFQHSGSNTVTNRTIPTANVPNIIGITTPGNTTVPNYFAGVRFNAGVADFLPLITSSFGTMNPLGGIAPPAIWFRVESVM